MKLELGSFPPIGEDCISIPSAIENPANRDYTILRKVVNTEITDIHNTNPLRGQRLARVWAETLRHFIKGCNLRQYAA